MSNFRGKRFCQNCEHFSGLVDEFQRHFCKAYPFGIPDKFLNGVFEHLMPWKQNNEVVWASRKDSHAKE